jgi:hypothetical protein
MACYFPGSIMLRIGYIVVPGFQVMVFGGLTVFELANRLTKEPYYEIRLISESGGPVQSSLGYSVMTDSFGEGEFDTVIIGGVITGAHPASAALIEYLRGAVKNTRRVASMCTGAFFWLRPAFWTIGVPRLTGLTRANCKRRIRKSKSKKIGYLSWMVRYGLPRA